jgi:hypothetical protein
MGHQKRKRAASDHLLPFLIVSWCGGRESEPHLLSDDGSEMDRVVSLSSCDHESAGTQHRFSTIPSVLR